jgi:hypothetical protein
MNIRDEDQVSAVALVVESEAATAAPVADDGPAGLGGADALADTDAGADADASADEIGPPDAGVESDDE